MDTQARNDETRLAFELLFLSDDELGRHVEQLADEVRLVRNWLGEKERHLSRVQRVRNARACRRGRVPLDDVGLRA